MKDQEFGQIDLPFHSDKITTVDPYENPHILKIYTKNGKIWSLYKRKGKIKLSKKWTIDKSHRDINADWKV